MSFAALIGAGAITILVLWLQPVPRGFELITTDDYERRTKRFAFIRDARAWMTRFSPKLFGFAPVQISGCYVESDGDEQAHTLLGLPPPEYSPNAVRVWILASNLVARAERNTLSDNRTRWRNNTSDGTPSALSMGPGRGSLEFSTHPKVRGNNVDLATKLRSFSVITGGVTERTNHEAAFRMLLKPHEGGIIIDRSGVLFIWAHAPPRQR